MNASNWLPSKAARCYILPLPKQACQPNATEQISFAGGRPQSSEDSQHWSVAIPLDGIALFESISPPPTAAATHPGFFLPSSLPYMLPYISGARGTHKHTVVVWTPDKKLRLVTQQELLDWPWILLST